MKKGLATVCILSLAPIACSRIEAISNHNDMPMAERKQRKTEQIEAETALRIAKTDATKSFGAMLGYNDVVCNQAAFWRVFFEPVDLRGRSQVIEYVVTKRGGVILARHKLPLEAPSGEKMTQVTRVINESDAIKIAARDAALAYSSLREFELTTCELKAAWRIIYAPREKFNGGGPEYLIDKSSGQILDKKYYQ